MIAIVDDADVLNYCCDYTLMLLTALSLMFILLEVLGPCGGDGER